MGGGNRKRGVGAIGGESQLFIELQLLFVVVLLGSWRCDYVLVVLPGLFTQDLTYLRAMAKRTGSSPKNGHGAFAEKMEMILDRIEYYQQSDYDTIECLPHIEKYLLSVKYIEEFQAFVDEDLFKYGCL